MKFQGSQHLFLEDHQMGKYNWALDLLGKPIGALGDLFTSKTKKETVDPTRRKIVAGTIAAPLAVGALGGIPQKIVKEIAPTIARKAPISSFRNMLTNSVQFRRAVLEDEVKIGHLSELEDIIDKEFTSINQLNDSEVNEVFEYLGNTATPYPDDHPFMVESRELGIEPSLRSIESTLKSDFRKILNDSELSVEDFVKGGKQTDDLFGSFVNKMKESDYTDEEIIKFLNDSLDSNLDRI